MKHQSELQVKQDWRISLKSPDQICSDWRLHNVLFLVDAEVDWQHHFFAPQEISSSCSIYLTSTSGLLMHCVLTHPVYYGKCLTANSPLFPSSWRCQWHCSHYAHIPHLFLLFSMIIFGFLPCFCCSKLHVYSTRSSMLYSCVDIWELLAIYHNNNDMFAETAIWETRFCVCTCVCVHVGTFSRREAEAKRLIRIFSQ